MPHGKKFRTLEDILAAVKNRDKQPLIVLAGAEQEEGLKCLDMALRHGIVKPVLIGDKRTVLQFAKKAKISLKKMELIDEADHAKATQKAVEICRNENSILMKGIVSTDSILRAVLNRETGLSTGRLISNVSVFESPVHKRLMLFSDPAVNINPDVSRKIEIVANAVYVANRLEIARPKVALLAATDKINIKDIPATADAAVITKMYESGQLKGADVAGPYGLDIAVSPFAAKCKNIVNPVAGHADILICPDINSANIFYKTLIYFTGCEIANAMLGAKVPLVMSSRSDSSLTKLYTIALSVMVAGEE